MASKFRQADGELQPWVYMVTGVVFSPLLLLIWLIPEKLRKSLIWLLLLCLGYSYVYPKHNLWFDLRVLLHHLQRWRTHFSSLHNTLVGGAHLTWRWLDNETNATLLAAIAAILGLVVTSFVRRADAAKKLRERLDRRTPNLSLRFTLSEDRGWLCTVVNLGAGTALAVRFRYYVLDYVRPPSIDDPSNYIGSNRALFFDKSRQVWRLHKEREFAFLLPDARSPRIIALGIIPANNKREVRVDLEYEDVLDRIHTQNAYGGQSVDGDFMSLDQWSKTVRGRVEKESWLSTSRRLLRLQVLRAFWQANLFKMPQTEADQIVRSARVAAYWKRANAMIESPVMTTNSQH